MPTTRSMKKVLRSSNQEATRISARRLKNPPRVFAKKGEVKRRELDTKNRRVDNRLSQDMGESTDIYTQSGKLRVEFVGKSRRIQTFEDDYDDEDYICKNLTHDNEDHGYDRNDGFIVDEDDPVIYESDEDEEVLSYDTDDTEYDSDA